MAAPDRPRRALRTAEQRLLARLDGTCVESDVTLPSGELMHSIEMMLPQRATDGPALVMLPGYGVGAAGYVMTMEALAKSAESPTTEEMKARASSLFGWKIALLLDRSASSPVSADTAPRLPIFALEGLARPPDGPWAALPDGVPPAMMIASIHRRASSSLVPFRM